MCVRHKNIQKHTNIEFRTFQNLEMKISKDTILSSCVKAEESNKKGKPCKLYTL